MPAIAPKIVHQIVKTALIAGAFAVVGCDDTHSADKRVQNTVAEARLARAQEGGAEKAQQMLAKAASEADASAATKAHVKALLGHAYVDAANERINHPTEGINFGHREIARLVWELGQLG